MEEDDFAFEARAVTAREWQQIEDVPSSTRAVGRLFAEAAAGGGVDAAVAWNAARWALLRGEPVASGKKLSKRDILLRQSEEKQAQEDRRRAEADAVPRFEAFGGRLEAYVHGLLAWSQRPASWPEAAFALLRAERFLADVVESGSARAALRHAAARAEPLDLLRRAAADEELLARPCFAVPQELRLHPEQRQVVDVVLAAVQEGAALALRYCTPPSGGKTSAVALLGAFAARLPNPPYVVYSCHAGPVRVDVCRHLVAASVPFAIVQDCVASPSASCFFGKARAAATQPPPSAAGRATWSLRALRGCDRRPIVLVADLRSARELLRQRRGDVLLFDEPTARLSAAMADEQRALLATAPMFTVLLGATLPPSEALLGAAFATEHGEPRRLTVASARLGLAVTAVDAQGAVYGPHDFGASVADVRGDPHLLRFCSPRLLLRLCGELGEAPSLDEVGSFEGVRSGCLRLLATSPAPRPPPAEAPLDLVALCCGAAARFPGCSLVLVDGGADAVVDAALPPLLTGMPQLRRALRAADRRARRLERHGGDDDEGMWPEWAVVNSREHTARHSAQVPAKFLRGPLQIPDDAVRGSHAALAEALLCGVVPLCSKRGDGYFELVAQSQAESGRASFVLGGRELLYGLNLPVDRVILDLSLTRRDEAVQACGRAGRAGRACRAEVVFRRGMALALSPAMRHGFAAA